MTDVILTGPARKAFTEDLVQARKASFKSETEFAADVLKVSLNTYRKCIDPEGAPLRIRRNTLLTIIKACKLDPARYGIAVPETATSAAAVEYTKDELGFLQGRFVLFRRSFLTGKKINVSTLDFTWDDARNVMQFCETVSYLSDRGVRQSFVHTGIVRMHAERILMSLLSIEDGAVRLTLLHRPDKPRAGGVHLRKLRGTLLAHGYPKGFFQPVVTPIYIEEADRLLAPVEAGTIDDRHPDFNRLQDELRLVEDHSIVLTSMLYRSST